MPCTTASSYDAGVGTKDPSTLVDSSWGTKTAPPKTTTSAGSSKSGGASPREKGTGASKALILEPLPKQTTPKKLPLKKVAV